MKFQLRDLDKHVHICSKVSAARDGISLNTYFLRAIEAALQSSCSNDVVVQAAMETPLHPLQRPKLPPDPS